MICLKCSQMYSGDCEQMGGAEGPGAEDVLVES